MKMTMSHVLLRLISQRVYFSSRNLIGRFVGVLLKDDAEKQHFEDPSGKLASSLHILLLSQMLNSLKYDKCTKKFEGVSSTQIKKISPKCQKVKKE